MNKFDLEPTKDNLIQSIKKNVTGRNSSLYNFLRLLNSQDEPLSIAITGSWGDGKTFFVKQCQLLLDSISSSKTTSNDADIFSDCEGFADLENIKVKHFRTAYFDAWEHDDDTDPLLSIMQCLVQSPWPDAVKEGFTKLINITSLLISALTPINTEDIKKHLQEKKTEDPEQIKQDFTKELSKLAPKDGKLIIFIDELDRCKPTYAVKLLEKIKHYFSNANITFIFSVDLDQLQHTIKNYYGDGFDGLQYLDRFFDLVIPLPEPDIDRYFENTNGLLEVDSLFKSESGNSYYQRFCINLIRKFNFSLRQINHFYLKANSSGYAFIEHILDPNSIYSRSEKHGSFIIYAFFLPFMNALIESDITQYQAFINGNASNSLLKLIAEDPEFIMYFNNFIDTNQSPEMSSNISGNIPDIQENTQAVIDIYDAIFGDHDKPIEFVKISNKCLVDSPSQFRKILIEACSLLSPSAKFDFSDQDDPSSLH
jgi:hypothetical protein